MSDVLKLKVSKDAIKHSILDDAHIDKRPRFGIQQDPYCKLRRTTVYDLVTDYRAMLKALKRAGVTVEQPSDKRNLGNVKDLKGIPKFLLKDAKPEPKKKVTVKKKRRVRL